MKPALVPYCETHTITSIQDMLLQSARRHGNKLALKDFNPHPISSASYDELLGHVKTFGTALGKLGLKERSHIAIIGENRVQWGIAYLAAVCYNHVVVPVDKNLGKTEILNIIHESGAQAVVFSEAMQAHFETTHSSLKKIKSYISMDADTRQGDFLSMTELMRDVSPNSIKELPEIDPEVMSIIVFTSGSLGRAKGVVLTQKNIAANLMGMVKMIEITPDDRFLSVLPMHHTYECTCGFLCPLYKGGSVYFARSLKTVVEDLQQSKATVLLAVPLLFEKMYKNIRKGMREKMATRVLGPTLMHAGKVLESIGWKQAPRTLFKTLHEKFGGHIRLFIAGGAAPDPNIAAGLRTLGFTFRQGYGLTETGPILALNRVEVFKDEAAGLPLPGVRLKILSPDENGVGEVAAMGDNIMPGYYKNEQATGETFTEDGWYRTGDLGRIDDEGFLHISGRKKNVIIAANGKNVFPEELEDLLNKSPYILESVVYGEQHKDYNERIAAQIVVDGEALIARAESKKQEITREWVQQLVQKEVDKVNKQVATFKRIQHVIVRDDEFAKTTTQKIKRHMVGKDPSPVSTEGH